VETEIQISRPAQVLTAGTRFAFRGNEIDLAFQTGGQLAVDDGDSLWTTTMEAAAACCGVMEDSGSCSIILATGSRFDFMHGLEFRWGNL
jgi:hypothetical protein